MPLITTPFGFHSTAADVIRGIDLRGRRVVITGAAAGRGIRGSGESANRGEPRPAIRRDGSYLFRVSAGVAMGPRGDRWQADGITSNAVNPGAVATGLQKHTGGLKTPMERRKTVEQGAATSVLLAASPLLEGVSGRYFEDCNEAPLIARRPTDFSGGVAPFALDPANAERLWDVSLKLIARRCLG